MTDLVYRLPGMQSLNVAEDTEGSITDDYKKLITSQSEGMN